MSYLKVYETYKFQFFGYFTMIACVNFPECCMIELKDKLEEEKKEEGTRELKWKGN